MLKSDRWIRLISSIRPGGSGLFRDTSHYSRMGSINRRPELLNQFLGIDLY